MADPSYVPFYRRFAWGPAAHFGAILLFFFVSGACALLYQVVWTRKLVLLFGTTSYAVSTVLAIIFLGLGVGSLLGGRLSDGRWRPLRVYGVFELIIGLWAALFIVFMAWGESAVVAILQATQSSWFAGIVLRAALAGLLLLVPVTLMGATLPLIAKYVTGEMSLRGRRIGVLYSVNTFGAVAGAMAAGFWLVPEAGYTLTTFVGAAANAGVGIVAIALSLRTEKREPRVALPDDASVAPSAAGTRNAFALAATAFAVSGFCAIALEVFWTRLLVLVFAGTTYAYTTMLASMLCGIALGSAAMAPFADRRKHPAAAFGFVLMLNGAACVFMLGLIAALPARYESWAASVRYAWPDVQIALFAASFLCLLPATALFGMGFPLAVRAATAGRARLGRDIGRLYGANTFAGVAGAIAGGYLVIPAAGTHNGVVLLAGVLALTGLGVVWACPSSGRGLKAALACVGLAAGGGAYLTSPADVSLSLNQSYLYPGDELLHYAEGVEGTVAVAQPGHVTDGTKRTIYINRVQATVTIDRGLKMNRFQGVLPMAFERMPRDILFMCFGSGSTLGMLAQWDGVRIDAVEISPEVLEAAEYFRVDNLDVRNNPKVTFHINDGRNFLLTTRKSYDLITFEPMPLALAGVSTFYSREYYELCLSRLNPGGIVQQWVPLHSLDIEIVRSLTSTFTAVFPYYNAWFINADLFLVGSNEPLRIDYGTLEDRLSNEAVRSALAPVNLADPVELINHFCMDRDGLTAFSAGGSPMGDDRPWAEFAAPKVMHHYKVEVALGAIEPHLTAPTALVDLDRVSDERRDGVAQALARRWDSRRIMFKGIIAHRSFGAMGDAERYFLEALDIDPENLYARFYLKDIMFQKAVLFLRWGGDYLDQAIEGLSAAVERDRDEPLYQLLLGDAHFDKGMLDEASRRYAAYLALGGDEARATERLGAETSE